MREASGGRDLTVEGNAGAVAGDPVEGFGPPFVSRYAEAWDGGGIVGEELDLFREREEGDERESSIGDGERGVAKWV